MVTSDKGYVIFDKDSETYYCGLNTWDKQLRKAKIYHSKRYLSDALNVQKDKVKHNMIPLKVTINIVN